MDIKNEKWYLPLVNKIDIDQIIINVAESHGWNDDERWSVESEDEIEEDNFINTEDEWFAAHYHIAEHEAIEEIIIEIEVILKEDYSVELTYNELYDVAAEILIELY